MRTYLDRLYVRLVTRNLCLALATVLPAATRIGLRPIVEKLPSPATTLVDPMDNSGRLMLTTRAGQIRIFRNGQLEEAPLLDIIARVITGGERGLLGLAFHPQFAQADSPHAGKFYTYHSERANGQADFPLPAGVPVDHQAVVSEWRVDANNPDRADPDSRRELMRIDQPQANHNGGDLHFGPDGLLYLSLGDGGAANDLGPGHSPQGNGQDTGNILGSMVRIDVNGRDSANAQYGIPPDNPFANGGGVREIYAWGLRNPYRFSFDRRGGALFAGDVGQNRVEEIDVVVRGGNFGWPLKEGSFAFDRQDGTISPETAGLPAGLVDPIKEFGHEVGISVIGGFVYRGTVLAELAGLYVFGDLGIRQGRLFVGTTTGGDVSELLIGPDGDRMDQQLIGFGQDAAGELYVLGNGGTVWKIVPVEAQ